MQAPAVPDDEVYRLSALRSLGVLDSDPEPDFDTIVGLGRALFQVPICLVSLIDEQRQWFKARLGLPVLETGRDISFCGHAILGDDVFTVLDAAEDERFHDNPLVLGAPFIRFYAGAPIRLPSGYKIGTVCIISPEPRDRFDEEQKSLLKGLADLAVNAFALRALRREMDQARRIAERYRAAILTAPLPMALTDPEGVIQEANPPFEAICETPPEGHAVTTLLAPLRGLWPPDQLAITDGGAIALPPHGKLFVYPDLQGYLLVVERRARPRAKPAGNSA
jgi:GAF domain-containing protein